MTLNPRKKRNMTESIWASKKPYRCPWCGLALSERRVLSEGHINEYCKERPTDAPEMKMEQCTPEILAAYIMKSLLEKEG